MKAVAFALCLFLPAAVNAAEWTKADTIRQSAIVALSIVDYGQTKYAFDNPEDFEELNPLVSEDNVEAFFIVTNLASFAISYFLPPKPRRWWQYINIGLKAACVGNNFMVGARVEF